MENMKVGQIYSTKDYGAFKKLKGNRSVLQRRKNLILASIRDNGWIRNPIVVNEKMEIVDGQGRFEALKELDMPIEYCISEGSTTRDCVTLNLKQKNWGTLDYITCYAGLGYQSYITLLDYIRKYGYLGVEQVCAMLCDPGELENGRTGHIRNGTYVMKNPETADDRLQFLSKALECIGKGSGRIKCWAAALRFVYSCPLIDNDRMISTLEKNIALLDPCVNTESAIRNLERVYNYNIRGRVYFVPEYDKYRHGVRMPTVLN